MALSEHKFGDWSELKGLFLKFAEAAAVGKPSPFVFRGQADSSWPLRATLDRVQVFESDEARDACRSGLIREFRRLSAGFIAETIAPRDESEWELLGRHCGLPMPILDWTTSAHVAASFAFDEEPPNDPEFAALWVLDRRLLLKQDIPGVEFIDEDRAIRFNPRAIEQRSVFLRVGIMKKPLEEALAEGLYKLLVPRSERALALADLDAGLVNARTLFRDLDGAARTARNRALSGRSQQ